jgi:hypothetical protein
MKHSAKNKPQPAQPPRPTTAPVRTSPLRWLFLVLALGLVAFGASWAVMEFVVWNKVLWGQIPGEIIGKWVVEGGDQDGATFDFHRSGAMRGHINVGGNEHVIVAQVAVEGETLFITTKNPRTKMDETKKHTIKVLNGRELVLQDERKTVFRMERARR